MIDPDDCDQLDLLTNGVLLLANLVDEACGIVIRQLPADHVSDGVLRLPTARASRHTHQVLLDLRELDRRASSLRAALLGTLHRRRHPRAEASTAALGPAPRERST
jgi:hypothetical protein